MQSSIACGLLGVEPITDDDHAGLKKICFSGISRQRRQFYFQQSSASYVPRQELKAPVAADLRAAFNTPVRQDAERLPAAIVEKHRDTAPRLVAWSDAEFLKSHDRLRPARGRA